MRITKPSLKRRSLLLVSVLLAGLITLGVYGGTVKADDLPVTHVSGSLTENTTWTNDSVYLVDDDITVPDGITLTINAGTIVKYATGWGNEGIRVASGGTLNVNGTSGSPVYLTSIKDDSVGGDSGGNGPTIGAAMDFSRAVYNNGGAVSMTYTTVRYAYTGFDQFSGGSTTITDSVFNSQVTLGTSTSAASLQRNQFDVDYDFPLRAIQSDVSGVILAGLNKNTFLGSGKDVAFYMDRASVGTGSTWAIDAASGVVPYVFNFTINGDVTVGAGTVIKAQNGGSNEAITVNSGGEFIIDGTSTSSVVITSAKDDSVGGDSGGDGSTSGALNDYGNAIRGNGGSVDVEYATIRYGSTAYTNNGSDALSMKDSTLESGVWLSGFTQGNAILQRNQFNLSSGYGNYPIVASNTDVSGISMAGSNKNSFSGSDRQKAVFLNSANVASSASWQVSSTTGAVLKIYNLTVNGTLMVDSGVVIKYQDSGTNNGIIVASGGNLYINGTSGSPVVLTSSNDDSVGGDTDGDGSTTGAFQDYGYAVSMASGAAEAEVTHATVKYASAGFYVLGGSLETNATTVSDVGLGFNIGGGEPYINATVTDSAKALNVNAGDVIFRGSMDNVDMGITACSWASGDCSVDAAYVDWGSDLGPFPNGGSDELACGAVMANPWLTSTGTDSDEVFGIPNCGGAPTPTDELSSASAYFYSDIPALQIDCANLLQSACDAIGNAFACLGSAVNLAAGSTVVPVAFTSPTEQQDDVEEDAVAAATDYILEGSVPTPSVYSNQMGGRILGVIDLLLDLKNAYATCAP